MNDIRENIQSTLKSKNALEFLNTLGYHSHRTGLNFANFADFKEVFPINIDEFAEVPQLLFQLTWEDLFASSAGSKQVDNTIMESYLFFAIPLKQSHYSRTALAKITRDLNRFANQPVMVIFTYGEFLTLSIINRRLHQRDESRDVLEKVTLIKDISVTNPHRAHLDILADLSYDRLKEDRHIDSFVALHEAWQQVLDTRLLNKQFYQELAVLFTRLVGGERGTGKKVVKETGVLKLPSITDEKIRKEFAVRLLGRLLFCWFLQKKTSDSGLSLVPEAILSVASVTTARDLDFYHAVLEPLFFETLNKPLADRQPSFQTGDWAAIPFLNGGLFEPHVHDFYDGSCTLNTLIVPDNWLTELLTCFEQYHFTIEENTPIEVQVAIDPEMLGQIFENLLAEINPETGETARKTTGSYYTPREIVDYMVEESLLAYFSNLTGFENLSGLRALLSYSNTRNPFKAEDTQTLLSAIENIKILDPACGSGAFPMGILHKLVFILGKLDENNLAWRQLQKQKAIRDTETAFNLGNHGEREARLKEINNTFENNSSDYGRKLYLIRECIYGVDIQPIAVEISRLRCFLALMVEENITDTEENRGILPLPNLAFKFVGANTLIGLPQRGEQVDSQIAIFEEDQDAKELKELREEYLTVQEPQRKAAIQTKFKDIQAKMFNRLLTWNQNQQGVKNSQAQLLLSWKPFEDESCAWFDPFWMFGVKEGFEIVIGNPPYVFARNSQKKGLSVQDKEYFYDHFELAEYQVNLYPLFIEQGHHLLKEKGLLSYITPNNWLTINTNRKLRKFVLAQSDIQIVNFYAQVFESAAVDSAILIFQKGSDHPSVTLLEYTDGFKLVKQVLPSYFLTQKDCLINLESFKDVEGMSLIEKMELHAIPLSSVADIKVGLKVYQVGKGKPVQTPEVKENRIYHANTKLDGEYFKYLEGKDVGRYYLGWSGEFLKYGVHLAEPRSDFGLFSTKRILVRQIPSKPPYCINACLTEEVALNDMNSMNIINFKESHELILAILNSKLISYWFVHKFGKMQRGTFPQFKINELASFPIPKTFEPYREILVNDVNQIIAARRSNPAADTRELESEIDRLVYRLYGLTEEEIAVIEGG